MRSQIYIDMENNMSDKIDSNDPKFALVELDYHLVLGMIVQ